MIANDLRNQLKVVGWSFAGVVLVQLVQLKVGAGKIAPKAAQCDAVTFERGWTR